MEDDEVFMRKELVSLAYFANLIIATHEKYKWFLEKYSKNCMVVWIVYFSN